MPTYSSSRRVSRYSQQVCSDGTRWGFLRDGCARRKSRAPPLLPGIRRHRGLRRDQPRCRFHSGHLGGQARDVSIPDERSGSTRGGGSSSSFQRAPTCELRSRGLFNAEESESFLTGSLCLLESEGFRMSLLWGEEEGGRSVLNKSKRAPGKYVLKQTPLEVSIDQCGSPNSTKFEMSS